MRGIWRKLWQSVRCRTAPSDTEQELRRVVAEILGEMRRGNSGYIVTQQDLSIPPSADSPAYRDRLLVQDKQTGEWVAVSDGQHEEEE